jgi:hypothetical protein
MKTKYRTGRADDLRPKYNLRPLLRRGMMGKYVAKCQKGMNIVRLEPEVAKAFPSESAVNEALRLAIRLSHLSFAARRLHPSAKQKMRGPGKQIAKAALPR